MSGRNRQVLPECASEALASCTEIQRHNILQPDVICGGFPCQDISTAGSGSGVKEGKRSGLWAEMLTTIRTLRPRYVIIENVSALSFRGLDIVLLGLAKAGYDAEWFTLSAAEVGAPHRRERMFILANTNSFGCQRGNDVDKSEGCQTINKARDDRTFHITSADGENENVAKHNGIWDKDPADEESTSQSFVGRVAYGIPYRMDRIKALGNAVVSQVAEVNGRRLNKHG